MSTTVNTVRKPRARTAPKSKPVAKDKPGNAKPAAATVTTSTVIASNADAARERIAKMGDNSRAFFTGFEKIAHDLAHDAMAYARKSDNMSLDMVIAVYAMRELVDIGSFVKGTKTDSANKVQTQWLQTYVPTYAANIDRVNRALNKSGDFYAERRDADERDAAIKANEAIRVMFDRVCHAAFQLEHVKASDIGTEKKGNTRALTYVYMVQEKGVAPVPTKGIASVSRLVSAGKELVKSHAASTGRTKGKGTRDKGRNVTAAAAAPTAKEMVATVAASAQSMTENLNKLTGDNRHDAAKAPQVETFIITAVADRFGTFDNQHKLTRFDLAAFAKWLTEQTYFKGVQIIGTVAATEIVKAEDAVKSGIKSAGTAGK